MSHFEVALWSATLGIYFCYACTTLFLSAYHRSWLGVQLILLILSCGALIMFGSGLGALAFRGLTHKQEATLVMGSGAFSAAYCTLGLRDFLRAEQRDHLVDRGLLAVVVLCVCLLFAPLWPNTLQALEMVCVGALLAAVLAFWLCVRAWLLGDSFALPMSLACLALVFAVLGLYGLSLGMFREDSDVQLISALCASLYVVLVCHSVHRRFTEYRRMSESLLGSRDKDLLTQLWTGTAFVRLVDEAITRAKRNRKELALINVELFNAAALRNQHGHHGMEQVIYGMASRIRRLGGTVLALGRYSETSFVMVLDSVEQPRYLRTLGLRVATGVRRPYVMNAFRPDSQEFVADIGVGISRISFQQGAKAHASNESMDNSEFDSLTLAQKILHEATVMAVASKKHSSKAAIRDDSTGIAADLKSAFLA